MGDSSGRHSVHGTSCGDVDLYESSEDIGGGAYIGHDDDV